MRHDIKVSMLAAVIFCGLQGPALADDYSNQTLTKRDLQNKMLNGASFANSTLDYANFTRASVKQGNFQNATCNGAIFWETDLSGANFKGATGQIMFQHCNLQNANLEGLNFGVGADCDFRGANLQKTVIWNRFLDADCRGANFCGSNMKGASMGKGSAGLRFQGASYDDNTAWPEGFDPASAGAVKK